MPTGHIRVGMAGWVFPAWRGIFYPAGLRQADELAYASRRVTSIELNGSYYSIPQAASWQAWHDATPDDFVFAVKAPRYITVIKKLKDVEEPVERFLSSGITALGSKLGPILWQLQPDVSFDPDLMATFLTVLERAAEKHGPLRHAFEVRSPTFDHPDFRDLAEKHGVAVVLGDTENGWPVLDWPTADFAYARLHGDLARYPDGYDDAGIDRWASWVRDTATGGRDVFAYCVTENKVHSPRDAEALLAALAT
jgi:uncharacterized protein YecE (DUF72 family)